MGRRVRRGAGFQPAGADTAGWKPAPRRTRRPGRAQDPLPAGKKRITLDHDLRSTHWSQDGKTVVTQSTRKAVGDARPDINFKTVEVWDARTGKQLQSLGEIENPGFPFHYVSADGARLVISQQFRLRTGEMEVWDVARITKTRTVAVPLRPRPIHCIVLAPKGDRVVDIFESGGFTEEAGPGRGGYDVFDTATGQLVKTLREESAIPRTAVFTPDSGSLVTRGSNDAIRLWDVASGKVVREAQASKDSGYQLALSPDGKTLVIPTARRVPLQVWSVPDLKDRGTIPNPFTTVMQVTFSPAGKRLLVAGYRDALDPNADTPPRSGVMVWDLERKVTLHDWETTSLRCGFCGEDEVGIGAGSEITVYPIGRGP